jgi:hypothetical protein
MRIALVGQTTFEQYARNADYQLYVMEVSEVKPEDDCGTVDDEDKDEDNEEELKKEIPPEYHDYLDLFRKKEGEKLPPCRLHVDHKIELISGAQPTFGLLYQLSELEMREL